MSKKEEITEKISLNNNMGLLYSLVNNKFKQHDKSLLRFANQFDSAVRHNNNTLKMLAKTNILSHILQNNLLKESIEVFSRKYIIDGTNICLNDKLHENGFNTQVLVNELLNVNSNNLDNMINELSKSKSELFAIVK